MKFASQPGFELIDADSSKSWDELRQLAESKSGLIPTIEEVDGFVRSPLVQGNVWTPVVGKDMQKDYVNIGDNNFKLIKIPAISP